MHRAWLRRSLRPAAISRRALKCYDSDRRRFGNWLVARGRRIGDHVEAQLRHDEPHDCGGLDPRHEVIMRELGAGGVIDGKAISARCG